ncbi:MAG: M3 family oligoendopeptidase [Acidimicrobiia bacterium]
MTLTESDRLASDVAWDLTPLLDDVTPEQCGELLDRADVIAVRLAQLRGTLADLDADAFVQAMQDLAAIEELVGRVSSYAGLRFATDMNDPANGQRLQMVEERATAIGTKLVFFELEWAGLDEARAEALLADPRLAFCAHHLRNIRRYREHMLTEHEEVLMAEKAVTGANAWDRLFSEQVSAVMVNLDGAPTSLEAALSRLASPDHAVRKATAEAITAALAPGLRTRAFIYNTLLADKAIDDRFRRYPSWVSSRNLSNEASDASVQALIDAVQRRYDIPQRWYALKAQLLGVDRLYDYDRMASVTDRDPEFGWQAGCDIVLESYASFSEELAGVAREFVTEPWIDAPVRDGKRPGAFCAYTVPSVHPFVMLNWTARRRDVLTLAHELGHALHAHLARPQGPFHQATPLTLAETASVFGETVTFGRLLAQTTDPEDRLALCAESLEGAIATVFRQVAMNRFEDAVHTARRTEGELSVERFGECWYNAQHAMLGDAVEITDGYRTWWSYVPHFISTPGYVYAYAYGQLLALSVYRQYEEHGEAFVPAYLALLRAGGSLPPEELGAIVGVDLADPGFWDGGLAIIETQLETAEAAARAAGRL